MGDNNQLTGLRRGYRNGAALADRVVWIRESGCQRVPEHSRRDMERQPTLAPIAFRFGGIPCKLHVLRSLLRTWSRTSLLAYLTPIRTSSASNRTSFHSGAKSAK